MGLGGCRRTMCGGLNGADGAMAIWSEQDKALARPAADRSLTDSYRGRERRGLRPVVLRREEGALAGDSLEAEAGAGLSLAEGDCESSDGSGWRMAGVWVSLRL